MVATSGTESMEDLTTLLISNLPQTMTDYQLRLLFMPMGEIVSAKILRDKSGGGYSNNCGSGHVIYQNPEDAVKAMVTLNGLTVSDKRIQVSYVRVDTEEDTNLYVGNVPQDCSEEDLGTLFGEYGTILTKKLLRGQGGKIGGIAFIRFHKKIEAASAMQSLKGYKFPGAVKGLRVKVAEAGAEEYYSGYLRSTGDVKEVGEEGVGGDCEVGGEQGSRSRANTEQIENTNLFIGNVPQDCSEEDLGTLFGEYGTILTKKLMRGGKIGGIAFIRFSKKAEADTAMKNLKGFKFPGAAKGLKVKVAEAEAEEYYTGYLRMEDEVKEVGREVKEVGREVMEVGREVMEVGRKVMGVGRDQGGSGGSSENKISYGVGGTGRWGHGGQGGIQQYGPPRAKRKGLSKKQVTPREGIVGGQVKRSKKQVTPRGNKGRRQGMKVGMRWNWNYEAPVSDSDTDIFYNSMHSSSKMDRIRDLSTAEAIVKDKPLISMVRSWTELAGSTCSLCKLPSHPFTDC